jgi:TonB family protein
MNMRGHVASVAMVLLVASVAACGDSGAVQRVAQAFRTGAVRPDEIPRLVTSDLPFRYPPAMYARQAQGNVTLRLFVDSDGMVRRDSTRVEESSGYPALDSAAVRGSMDLRFIPAKLRGEPMGITVLFPVYFRHPEARALAGDSILNRNTPP